MENEEVLQETENPAENLDSTQENSEGDELTAKLSKAEEIARNQRIRAEKAEKELKALKQPVVEPKKEIEGLSLKDIRALQDVPDEDVDEVTEFAKFKGISIAEAKKSPVIQTLLKTKAEERTTAAAANTTTTRRSKSNSPDVLLSKIENKEDMSVDEMKVAAKALVASLKRK